jgi:hypothetical protein
MSIPTCNGGSLLRVEAFDTARFLPMSTASFVFLRADEVVEFGTIHGRMCVPSSSKKLLGRIGYLG